MDRSNQQQKMTKTREQTKEQKTRQRRLYNNWYADHKTNPLFRVQRRSMIRSREIQAKSEIRRQQLELQSMSKKIKQQEKQISDLESELHNQKILVEELRSEQRAKQHSQSRCMERFASDWINGVVLESDESCSEVTGLTHCLSSTPLIMHLLHSLLLPPFQ